MAILMKEKNMDIPDDNLNSSISSFSLSMSGVVFSCSGNSCVLMGNLQHGQIDAGAPSASNSELYPYRLAI